MQRRFYKYYLLNSLPFSEFDCWLLNVLASFFDCIIIPVILDFERKINHKTHYIHMLLY